MRPSPPAPLSHPLPPGRERGKKAAAGYNLVILMVLLTVLNIVIAASLPAWSGVIRQEKEEELVFRGLQYAEAIRVFQNRFQRPPIRLEELIEVEPRSIRKLWKDPMTENGKWALIPLQGPAGLEVQNPMESEDGRKGEVTEGKGVHRRPAGQSGGPDPGAEHDRPRRRPDQSRRNRPADEHPLDRPAPSRVPAAEPAG
jgi:type II secretory pathway pseudopilin PulG